MQRPVMDPMQIAEQVLGCVDCADFIGCVEFNGTLADLTDLAVGAEDVFVKATEKA